MKLIFIDIEATSLTHDSVPIEIGWATDGGDVEAHLIRPAPTWSDWSPSSEAVHQIRRSLLLEQGEPHDAVARRVLEVLGDEDAIVLSDAAGFDQAWLTELLHAAGHKRRIEVQDAMAAYIHEMRRLRALLPRRDSAVYPAAVDALRTEAAAILAEAHEAETRRRRVRHRAGPDAEGTRWVLEEIRRRVEGRL